jgi:hypothetical protein
MRRILLLGILFCLAGCQNINGPFMPRPKERVDDPRLSIAEQEMRARDRYAIPDNSPQVGPRSGNVSPFRQDY